MNYFKSVIAIFILLQLACQAPAEKENPGSDEAVGQRPNIIILMTDDQGYGELSAHGNSILKTPNLDKLHDESIRLTDFHVSPMCTPTRGQLLTGIDAVRNGAVNVSSGRTLLRPQLPTAANYFAEAGYQTGIFGKWHLGDNYPYRPEDRGFTESLWFPSSHIGSVPDYYGNDYFDDVYLHNGERKQYEGYCTNVFFSEAMDWMKKCSEEDKPFFTYIPTNAPHQPFYALEDDIKEMEAIVNAAPETAKMDAERKYNFIRYLAMIRNIDQNVAKLRAFLEENDLDKNTIFIFLTDNGSTFGPDYYNAGMRGKKTQLWEGGHRVPCFIHWPEGNLTAPADINGLTQVQDLLPTLLELCKIDTQSETKFSGQSLAAVLKGQKETDSERVLKINYSRMPFFFDYPSPYANSLVNKGGTGVLWKRWRLIHEKELYNLETDPMQENNVYDQNPDVVKHMETAMDQWWNEVKDGANELQRVPIGEAGHQNQMLTACEWVDVFVDQQIQIDAGERRNSYQLLDVKTPGKYAFELRRWPAESQLHITGGGPGKTSLPITAAKIYIDGEEYIRQGTKKLGDGEESISFEFELNQGPIALHTWFLNDAGEGICGAYYVNVTKI